MTVPFKRQFEYRLTTFANRSIILSKGNQNRMKVEKAMNYKIIVDSCCDLTEDMKRWPNLIAVPLTLQLGEYSIFDDDTFNQDDFIARMHAYSGVPRSACPSPEAFCRAIEGEEKDIYIITITDKLSGCYNSALQGKALYEEEHPEEKNIHVFNSLATSGLETLIAEKVKQLADSGADFEQVVADTQNFICHQTALFFCLESLDALKNNGRLFSLAATVIKKLKMKLICHRTAEGSIGLSGQDFASGRALTKMCDMICKDVEGLDLTGKKLIISYVCCPEKAEMIKSKISERCAFEEIMVLKASGLNSLYASDGGIIVSYSK